MKIANANSVTIIPVARVELSVSDGVILSTVYRLREVADAVPDVVADSIGAPETAGAVGM